MQARPLTEEELQEREAIGVIRASRFVRKYANSHQPISLKTVCEIHKEIFKDAWPEIAGVFRAENLTITDSKHAPPHYTEVADLMKINESVFQDLLKKLDKAEGIIRGRKSNNDPKVKKAVNSVIKLAAWIHHMITSVHPFRDGNGRTARLAANLILERFGLVGISIKVEKENKNRYRSALAQIDSDKDYKPLEDLIFEGLVERYQGVSLKYHKAKK